MKRSVDTSQYLAMMKELMSAGSTIGGVIPAEHVERYFKGGEVEHWMTEEENRVLLKTFWANLMGNEFSRGAVPFTLIEEVQAICAKLEAEQRVNDAHVALKEGKDIIKTGTLAYMFEESIDEYRKKWRDEGDSENR